MSDEELNSKILENLEKSKDLINLSQTKSKESDKNEIKCIVGGKECLYEDKNSMISGDVSSFVQLKFEQGTPVGLPSKGLLTPE